MPIDFGLSDPNAFYKGAANMNDFMSRIARQKAGTMLAGGDTQGATDTLNKAGDLEGANNIQLNLDNKDARLRTLTDKQRLESTQFVIEVAQTLDRVRMEGGPQAVGPAFEQLVPIMKARGATDEDLAPYRQGIAKDPQAFLNLVHQIATTHAKTYAVSPGQKIMQNGDVIASSPSRPIVAPAGSSVLDLSSPEPGPSGADNDAPPASALMPGHITHFANGQGWTLNEQNQPKRVE